jgi:DNA recombination protein RmuC
MIYFFIGFFSGLSIGLLVYFLTKQTQSQQTQSMLSQFSQLSNQSLKDTQAQFFSMASETLKGQTTAHEQGLTHKKALIDQTLSAVKTEIEQVKSGLKSLESNHQKHFGEMVTHLQHHRNTTQSLMQTTSELKEALANSKTRGQWGERMAEDVLRFSGLVEGINYVKQTAIDTQIPDFTFFLPKDKKVHMDVKFPLNHYLAYLNGTNPTEKDANKKQFMRDVRTHIKGITTRDYITPDTLDYVMIFIPNENIYQFMHDNDPELIDFSLQQKVVLCSPITLYAMLAVMRQAIDNFAIENKAKDMMTLLSTFQTQWDKYKESMDKMGKRLDDVQKEFTALTTTRTNQLERPLRKIQDIKQGEQAVLSDTQATSVILKSETVAT